MDNEAKQVALAFLQYCDANHITYKWSSTNRWNLRAKGRIVGYICVGIRSRDDGSWRILLDLKELLQYEEFIHKEGLITIFHNNIHYCEKCNASMCGKSEENPKFTTILGKKFRNICSIGVYFKNPGFTALDDIQKILSFRLALSHSTTSRPIFDPKVEELTRVDNTLRIRKISNADGKPNENMNNLFNGKYNNYFYAGAYGHMSNGNSHSILFELDEPDKIVMYGLVTGLRLNVPSGWALHGAESKDGVWVLLDAQGEFPKPVTLYTEKAFNVSNPKAYKYYRILFEGANFVLSQVHLYCV